MIRRFVISVDAEMPDEQARITDYFKVQGLQYWHWLQHQWLVVDYQDKWNVISLRNALNKLAPTRNNFVIQIKEDWNWMAMHVPKEAIDWINEHWSKEV